MREVAVWGKEGLGKVQLRVSSDEMDEEWRI
jgi:hypothetical protein